MHNNEWSLVFFTLISQLSVGILLMFSFLHYASPNTEYSFSIWWKSPEVVVLVLLGIAAIISLLHLGKPMNAPNSINNFMGSWISKEILSLGFLVASVFVLFLIRWVISSPIWLINAMLIVSSIAGLVFIYSMSRIYTIATIPSWDTWYTPVSFFFSVILFGITAIIFMQSQGIGNWSNVFQTKSLILILIVFLVIQMGTNAFHQYQLSSFENLGIEPISFTKGMYFSLFMIRTILLFVLAICFIFIYIYLPQLNIGSVFVILLMLAIISQEFIGRMMFYQSYFRIGV